VPAWLEQEVPGTGRTLRSYLKADAVAALSRDSRQRSFRNNGFPPMASVAIVSNAPSASSFHAAATLIDGTFTIISRDQLPPVPDRYTSALWTRYANNDQKPLQYATEADLSSFVSATIEDILCEMGLHKNMSVVREVKKFFWEPDLTVKAEGPVGAEETKKDITNIDDRVVGEVFDQLMYLKHYWMIRAPFVILSSYKHWRVCWLNDSESNKLAAEECSIVRSDDVGMATPSKQTQQDKSPPTSPEHHNEAVDLGDRPENGSFDSDSRVVKFVPLNCAPSTKLQIVTF